MTERSNDRHACDAGLDFFDHLNEELEGHFEGLIRRMAEKGRTEEEIRERLPKLQLKLIDGVAPVLAEAWGDDRADYVAQTREFVRDFRERLHDHWGDALDRYTTICGVVDSIGEAAYTRNLDAIRDGDLLAEVLHQLLGQACRVAREVEALLGAGFPLGALALSHTLHEIAVRTTVLGNFGREPGHNDLAQRYVDHHHVINYCDAEVYQRDASALGYEPFAATEIAELKRQHDAALVAYGSSFAGPYGWAMNLPDVNKGRFYELENLAELSHRRGYYQWSSHLVHGDSKALHLNLFERGGHPTMLTNATNIALADPASIALFGLQVAVVEVVFATEYRSIDVMTLRALALMVREADEAFLAGEQSVDEAEERLQGELAAQGLAMTGAGIIDLATGQLVPDADV